MDNTNKGIKLNAAFLNNNRAYIFLAIVLIIGIFIPNYYSMYNMTAILNGTCLYVYIGVAFSIAMIAGHMDLSVGYMSTTGAIVCLGMHTLSKLPWIPSILIAVAVGALVGIINGLFVTKGKIHSFIATLGMQFILKGGMYIYCNGAEISVKGDFELSDVFHASFTWLPISVFFGITLVCLIVLALILSKTRFGRNIYMLGGNLETAWLAGIKSDKNTIGVFVISAVLCALGGALFGIYQGTATPTLGEKGISPLMVGLTATIVGGVDINGGKGSIVKTFISILTIMGMYGLLTGKVEYQILIVGLMLAACVLYETLTTYKRNKLIGVRPNLFNKYCKETGRTKL